MKMQLKWKVFLNYRNPWNFKCAKFSKVFSIKSFFWPQIFQCHANHRKKVKSFWFHMICHETRVKVRISRVISSKKFYANWIMAQKSILGWKSWKFSSKSTREILGKTFASQKVLKNSKSFSRCRSPFQIIRARVCECFATIGQINLSLFGGQRRICSMDPLTSLATSEIGFLHSP